LADRESGGDRPAGRARQTGLDLGRAAPGHDPRPPDHWSGPAPRQRLDRHRPLPLGRAAGRRHLGDRRREPAWWGARRAPEAVPARVRVGGGGCCYRLRSIVATPHYTSSDRPQELQLPVIVGVEPGSTVDGNGVAAVLGLDALPARDDVVVRLFPGRALQRAALAAAPDQRVAQPVGVAGLLVGHDVLRAELAAIVGIVARLDADDLTVLDAQIHPALAAAEAAVG